MESQGNLMVRLSLCQGKKGGKLLDSYLSLDASIDHEIIINKSRFIGLTYIIESEAEISLCLEDARDRYPRASHYCYGAVIRSEEHTSELQSRPHLVCRLLL